MATRDERDLLDRIMAARYDVMLVFTSFSQSPWPVAHLGLLAGIPVRAVHSREFGGAVATHWITSPPDTTHHVDRSLHLLDALGVADRGRAPSLRVPPEAYRAGDALLARCLPAGPAAPAFVLAVPGASCPSRRYPAGRFGEAAAAVAGAGLPVLVVGTAAEAGLVETVVRAAATPRVAALPVVDLAVFAALVDRAAVAVTNNSAGLHLADALGTPVAALYAGTERLGDVAPRSVPAELLQVTTACSPCRQLVCPFHHECLDVPPSRVAAAVLRLAAGPHPPTPNDVPEEDRWTQVPAAVPTPPCR
jgi:ADP-heptose:LPS heptosyltransferase